MNSSSEFAVFGLGNFGLTVAEELARLGCRVTAVDNDKNRLQRADEKIHLAIIGDATDRSFLEKLDVEKFDCCIVSTGEDSHASIIICLYLKEMNAKKIIVKANNADHAKILDKLGATSTIIPEQDMAIRLANAEANANVIDYLPLTDEYCVAELVPPEKFIGKTLIELNLRAKHNLQVIAIKDKTSGSFNFVPGGNYSIKSSDIMITLGKRTDVDQIKG